MKDKNQKAWKEDIEKNGLKCNQCVKIRVQHVKENFPELKRNIMPSREIRPPKKMTKKMATTSCDLFIW